MQSAQSNPMYKENKMEGTNPLFEAHDSVGKRPAGTQPAMPEDARYRPGNNKTSTAVPAGAASTVEYKDPEDMTTRYRPGNNKTTTAVPAGGASNVEYKDPEDMTTRYRPGNNKTTKAPAAGVNKNDETVEYKDPEDTATRPKAPEGKTQNPN